SIPFLNGFCYMIRREVIDRIGIFDEQNFANYGEENDYSIRARQAGYRLVVATDAYVFHNSSRSYSPERRRAHQDRANQAMAAMGVKVTVLNLAAYQQALAKHATPNGRFLTFPDETALRAHLARLPVPYDVVVGTYYGSVYWLPKQRPPECAYGYYIQDFE